ncbi:VOC family protein [Lampropedia puyangensis]|uniref:VOC family protein n=1 Tax=Lampropedia puyangensis TaxID=1330072 RepID=A0A4S8FB69_9BURK|nr:VOC family protein [Lampropedia puyangensis]THU02842.1 VOC family protein [Lampropedia puyangensis]
MDPRITIITLGVANIARATAFYERLGFARAQDSNENVSFMQAGGVVLSLYGRQALADDAQWPADAIAHDASTFTGISLAHNTRSETEVDTVLKQAVAAGAQLLKPAQKVFWGGYSGYFRDLDGHLWEVAYNPFLQLNAAGAPVLERVEEKT